MKTRILALVLAVLCLWTASACADYFSPAAVTVNGTVYTPDELENAMRLHLIEASLNCISNGYGYDVTDPLNIIDALDKVLFDMELRVVVMELAEEMEAAELSPEAEEAAQAEAHETWLGYLALANSEQGRAMLPAGEFEEVEGDTEGNLIRYLASWGLTEDVLVDDARYWMVEEQLKQAVAGTLADEDEQLDFYTDWLLEWYDQADIEESGVGVAEVVLNLAVPEN